jgi:SAM-dependent methyltransferase
MCALVEMRQKLLDKSLDELSFWEPIARNGLRGFSAEQYREAAIHFKQYGLIQLGRDISHLTGKTVVELCCGPSAIVAGVRAAKAYGVDPLAAAYAALWDLSHDGVEYISTEIEAFQLGEQVDIVICWNGIDHVRNIEGTITKIRSLLKDDGEFWMFTNTEDCSFSPQYKKAADPGSAHQFSFNELSLDLFFRRRGWKWVTRFRYEPTHGVAMPSGTGGVLKKSIASGSAASAWAKSLALRLAAVSARLRRRCLSGAQTS